MTLPQILGVGIIAMVFVIIFFLMAKRVGYKTVLVAWGLCLVIAAVILFAVYLITGRL